MLTTIRAGMWRVVSLALWLALVVSAAKVTHDFYRYVDRSIYAAVDDSEANIAYDLATHGRYGFPASPVLMDMSRLDGQFNYGPWYFYLAGGLVWLFGFSLTLVRSIHLWLLLATVGVAGAWFSGRDRATVAVLYGLGILYAFEASQWPMARPDILVSAFALVFVVCAGLGALRSRPLYWFGAGVAATCGAFTHLIAASLIPSSVLVLAVVAWGDLRESTDRPGTWRYLWRAGLALILGIALGLAMFYASFGFDFGTQWQFLSGYRGLTKRSDTFLVAIGHHLNYAFAYLSPVMRYVVGAVFAASWLLAGVGERMKAPERRVVRASMLPPLVAWTGYILTGGGRVIGECCHFVDFLAFVAGSQPVDVSASAIVTPPPSTSDNVTLTVRFANGSIGTVHYFANGDPALPKEYVEVFGGGVAAQLSNFKSLRVAGARAAGRTSYFGQVKGFAEEATAVVEALKAGGPAPIAFADLLLTSRVTLAVETALTTGGRVVL